MSVFQSESEELLVAFAELIYVPAGALLEYERHGARDLLRALETRGVVEVIALDVAEIRRAAEIAAELVVRSPGRTEPAQHMGEAEAIALFEARRLPAELVLIDEAPARRLAVERGVPVAGFPGLLARLARSGRIGVDELRERLLVCQRLGTHYSADLIEAACRLAIGATP